MLSETPILYTLQLLQSVEGAGKKDCSYLSLAKPVFCICVFVCACACVRLCACVFSDGVFAAGFVSQRNAPTPSMPSAEGPRSSQPETAPLPCETSNGLLSASQGRCTHWFKGTGALTANTLLLAICCWKRLSGASSWAPQFICNLFHAKTMSVQGAIPSP